MTERGDRGAFTFVRKNGTADIIRDMDSLPPLPYHLIDFDKYSVFHLKDGRRSATLNTSRGCPYRCKFCSDPVINEGKWRGYSSRVVLEKVAGFSRQVQHLMFSRNASAGVLYPRHFLGVELTAHVISSISRAV